MATAAAPSAAAAAVAAVPTLSSLVRKLLVDAGNKPVRVNALFAAVRALPSAASVTKTHFKRRILGQMLVRDEVSGASPPPFPPCAGGPALFSARTPSRARPSLTPHPLPSHSFLSLTAPPASCGRSW